MLVYIVTMHFTVIEAQVIDVITNGNDCSSSTLACLLHMDDYNSNLLSLELAVE